MVAVLVAHIKLFAVIILWRGLYAGVGHYEFLEDDMNFNECYAAYTDAIRNINGAGPERDSALRTLSCIDVLAYDNHGYSYPVFIDADFSADPNNARLVLYAVGAPSGWNMEQLIINYRLGRSHLAFDFGQGWLWENFRDVMQMVLDKLGMEVCRGRD